MFVLVPAVVYQDILDHFMLSSPDKVYGDANFIFHLDFTSLQTVKGAKSWLVPFYYCAWLDNKLTWPENLELMSSNIIFWDSE